MSGEHQDVEAIEDSLPPSKDNEERSDLLSDEEVNEEFATYMNRHVASKAVSIDLQLLRHEIMSRLVEWFSLRWEHLLQNHPITELWFMLWCQRIFLKNIHTLSMEAFEYDPDMDDFTPSNVLSIVEYILQHMSELIVDFSQRVNQQWLNFDMYLKNTTLDESMSLDETDQQRYLGHVVQSGDYHVNTYEFVYLRCVTRRDQLQRCLFLLSDWIDSDRHKMSSSVVAFVMQNDSFMPFLASQERDQLQYHDMLEQCESRKNNMGWSTFEQWTRVFNEIHSSSSRSVNVSSEVNLIRNLGSSSLPFSSSKEKKGQEEDADSVLAYADTESSVPLSHTSHSNKLFSGKYKRKLNRLEDVKLKAAFPHLYENKKVEDDELFNMVHSKKEGYGSHSRRFQEKSNKTMKDEIEYAFFGTEQRTYEYNNARMTMDEIEVDRAFPNSISSLKGGNRVENDAELMSAFKNPIERLASHFPNSLRSKKEVESDVEDYSDQEKKMNRRERNRAMEISRRQQQERREQMRYSRSMRRQPNENADAAQQIVENNEEEEAEEEEEAVPRGRRSRERRQPNVSDNSDAHRSRRRRRVSREMAEPNEGEQE